MPSVMAELAVVGNEPPVKPAMKTFPAESTASAVAPSALGPPSRVPKTMFPAASVLPTEASEQGPVTDPIGGAFV